MKITRCSEMDFVPASHEDPNDPGVLKKVLLDKNVLAFGQPQMINWSALKPNKAFAPHYHQDMQEIFVMISGSAKIKIWASQDEAENPLPVVSQLNQGDAVCIEPNEIHTMWNDATVDAVYLALGIATGSGGQTINVSVEEYPADERVEVD